MSDVACVWCSHAGLQDKIKDAIDVHEVAETMAGTNSRRGTREDLPTATTTDVTGRCSPCGIVI